MNMWDKKKVKKVNYILVKKKKGQRNIDVGRLYAYA